MGAATARNNVIEYSLRYDWVRLKFNCMIQVIHESQTIEIGMEIFRIAHVLGSRNNRVESEGNLLTIYEKRGQNLSKISSREHFHCDVVVDALNRTKQISGEQKWDTKFFCSNFDAFLFSGRP